MRYEPIAPDDFCKEPTPTNTFCRYPAAICPLHENRFNSGPQPPEPAERWMIPGPGERPIDVINREPDGRKNPAELIRQVIDAIAGGDASPLQVQRLVRALQAIEKIQRNTFDEDAALAEASLRGVIMNGMTPFDQAQWDLAEQLCTDEVLAMLIMWAKQVRQPFPAALDERLGHPAYSHAHWDRMQWESGGSRDTDAPYDDPLDHDPVPLDE